MKYSITNLLLITFLTINFTTTAGAENKKPFAPNVDMTTGNIHVPEDYRFWPTLGTWSHANSEGERGAKEYHIVYTQPETIKYFQKHRKFPDGAVLVKELINTKTMPMTTGPAVSHATKVKGWFVLVRDTENRFKDSPLWGDGWGWSLFNAGDKIKTVSKDYQEDCIACHLPAREMASEETNESDKWIYFRLPCLK